MIRLQIERDAKLAQEKKDKELIEKYYGKTGLKALTAVKSKLDPFVLTIEELDDDKVLEALEKPPRYLNASQASIHVYFNLTRINSHPRFSIDSPENTKP